MQALAVTVFRLLAVAVWEAPDQDAAAIPVTPGRAALAVPANLDRDAVATLVTLDQDARNQEALDLDVHHSVYHTLDLPVAAVQSLGPPGAKVRLAARFPAATRWGELPSREVWEDLDQENREVWEDLDQDDQVVLAANLDQDDRVDHQSHRMEVRCNTRFLF